MNYHNLIFFSMKHCSEAELRKSMEYINQYFKLKKLVLLNLKIFEKLCDEDKDFQFKILVNIFRRAWHLCSRDCNFKKCNSNIWRQRLSLGDLYFLQFSCRSHYFPGIFCCCCCSNFIFCYKLIKHPCNNLFLQLWGQTIVG